jgi:sterol desaturase/sphingolipid hydroxylase (fatty acid hydroxylase superfamily)
MSFHILTVYLTYQEIAGHLGKAMYPTSSFAQCIWLPRLLGIQLYTEDHDLHHLRLNCNYSKRFSIWDRLFRTYITNVNNVENNNTITDTSSITLADEINAFG